MVRRSELIQMFVLNEISDGYECLHQIIKQLNPLSSAAGLTIETSEVIEALRDLIANGLAEADGIDEMPPTDEIGSPDEAGIDDVYFRMTEKGMQLQLSDCPDWPFDDRDVLRPDWKPPES